MSSPALSGHDRFELAFEEPVRRGTACVNIRHEDKAVFDAIQLWASHRRARSLSQWEVFSLVLAAALGNKEEDLAGAPLFPG